MKKLYKEGMQMAYGMGEYQRGKHYETSELINLEINLKYFI
jgi:hypothetical protein